MALVLLLLVFPGAVATWVSYWSTNLFESLSNRVSRTTCLICPSVMVLIAAAVAGIALGPTGADIEAPQLSPHEAPALAAVAATLLILPTLGIAWIVGRFFNNGAPIAHRGAQ